MIVDQYKRLEVQFARAVGLWFRRFWVRFVEEVARRSTQRFTLMVVPQSKNKILNFQISFFLFVFFISTITIVLAGFALLAMQATSANQRLLRVSKALDESDRALQGIRDATSALRRAERIAEPETRSLQFAFTNQAATASTILNPISSLYHGAAAAERGSLAGLVELKKARSFVEDSAGTLGAIEKVLKTYKGFVEDAPTMWPLKGAHGAITTRFGWTTNPFSGKGYLHLGVDIAWVPGTPIMAAGNGIVEQTGYNDALGNFVTIRHKYGFTTQYLHLERILTQRGASVHHGDVIGCLGSTGLSTGPHVDFRVRLGNNCLDPMNFLSIPPDLDMGGSPTVASD